MISFFVIKNSKESFDFYFIFESGKNMEDKRNLSETEIRTRYITPALLSAGWEYNDIHEEKSINDGRIIDEGNGNWRRGDRKRVDYLLTYNNTYIAIIEAKDNNHEIGYGMQQGMEYATILDVPFVFSSNGDGFIMKNMSTGEEKELQLDQFPSPNRLWTEYISNEKMSEEEVNIIKEPLYPGKYTPRYYQQIAIERTIRAVAKNQKKILLVMATGTGKTYTAFQIIYRLWKAGKRKRILYLADRNILIDQTMVNDFSPLKDVMTKIKGSYDPAYQIYMGLYQQLKGHDGKPNLYEKFPQNFFDLIVVDECHRGSASEESAWREILDYFGSATQIGLTATPKNEESINTFRYFGDPVYTYSLKQGIEDGFLAPYKVIRIGLDTDINGVTVPEGTYNTAGEKVDPGTYEGPDINRLVVIPKRDKLVAKIVTDYLKKTNRRMDKTIFFCVDEDHAERMRRALINENLDMYERDDRYVMRITGSDSLGKMQLDNFINPRKKYPTLVTTSKLLSTGVDVKTCKLIVIDATINSMVEFKQMIGRGTRISEEFNKTTFTIIDFSGATKLFNDPEFDGETKPIVVEPPKTNTEGKEGSTTEVDPPLIPIDDRDIIPPKRTKRPKIILPNQNAEELYRQERLLDENGNLIVDSFKQFVKNKLTGEYETYQMFKDKWDSVAKKEEIIRALADKNIYMSILEEEIGEEYDAFDLLVNVAYGKPLKTRSQRAKQVKKSEFFERYSEQARDVLTIILEKYVAEGIKELEDPDILNIPELQVHGTVIQIMQLFNGTQNYQDALKEMKEMLYREVA